ncbi:hypothetical protein K438DRAFT_1851458 [Mycena galopus ATCC 62051]|nr:hypothetical protein K438DRAFT_1851458 [Mycena galopus ATCC 62051]
MIGLILVLRFAALTYINTQTDRAKATKEAFAQYSACNWGAKVEVWLAASPRTAEEVFAFINSIPWDLVPKSEDKDGSL